MDEFFGLAVEDDLAFVENEERGAVVDATVIGLGDGFHFVAVGIEAVGGGETEQLASTGQLVIEIGQVAGLLGYCAERVRFQPAQPVVDPARAARGQDSGGRGASISPADSSASRRSRVSIRN